MPKPTRKRKGSSDDSERKSPKRSKLKSPSSSSESASRSRSRSQRRSKSHSSGSYSGAVDCHAHPPPNYEAGPNTSYEPNAAWIVETALPGTCTPAGDSSTNRSSRSGKGKSRSRVSRSSSSRGKSSESRSRGSRSSRGRSSSGSRSKQRESSGSRGKSRDTSRSKDSISSRSTYSSRSRGKSRTRTPSTPEPGATGRTPSDRSTTKESTPERSFVCMRSTNRAGKSTSDTWEECICKECRKRRKAAKGPTPPSTPPSEIDISKSPPKSIPIPEGITRGSPESPKLPDPIINPCDINPDDVFEVKKEIDEGTWSEVLLVRDKRDNKEKALKKMSYVNNARVQRECIIMSRLKNENICNLLEAYRVGNANVHILMEPCVMDLHAYIRQTLIKLKGDTKIGQIKHITLGILHGVEYMHGKAVLHRDLKTKNILLKAEGGIKICDFGLSRKIDTDKDKRQRHYSRQLGTICYMSPEMLKGKSDYGFETDMWSVACIIGEMFKGTTAIRSSMTTGDGKINQINAIKALCGDLTRNNKRHIREHFGPFTEGNQYAINFINSAFTLPPESRPNPREMIDDPFFTMDKITLIKTLSDG